MPEGIEINWQEGTVRVSASYSFKKGLEDYSSEDAHTSFGFEVPIPAGVEDAATLASAIVELHATIKDGAKLATLNELDMAHITTGDGVIRPVVTVQEIPVAAPVPTAPAPTAVEPVPPQPVAPVAPVQPAPAGGGTVVADFGFGEREYYDNRPKKAAQQYKPNAADFKSKDPVPENSNQNHAVWLTFPNGGANAEMQAAAAQYGLL
jgi:hypothetical protein